MLLEKLSTATTNNYRSS